MGQVPVFGVDRFVHSIVRLAGTYRRVGAFLEALT